MPTKAVEFCISDASLYGPNNVLASFASSGEGLHSDDSLAKNCESASIDLIFFQL